MRIDLEADMELCGSHRKCKFCDMLATRLCDYVLVDGICSSPVCEDHNTRAKHEQDYCPPHARIDSGQAWEA